MLEHSSPIDFGTNNENFQGCEMEKSEILSDKTEELDMENYRVETPFLESKKGKSQTKNPTRLATWEDHNDDYELPATTK